MRALLVAVVAMGVLIVAGMATLAVMIIGRVSNAVPAAVAGPVVLDEPAGTRIAGSSAAGDRLAIWLQGGGPDRVALVDVRSGRVVGRVVLAR